MVTNTKHTLNKSCSCRMCRLNRGSGYGQTVRTANNRRLRRKGKQALDAVKQGADPESVTLGPITSPYTD
jgi:hypothetical protein